MSIFIVCQNDNILNIIGLVRHIIEVKKINKQNPAIPWVCIPSIHQFRATMQANSEILP